MYPTSATRTWNACRHYFQFPLDSKRQHTNNDDNQQDTALYFYVIGQTQFYLFIQLWIDGKRFRACILLENAIDNSWNRRESYTEEEQIKLVNSTLSCKAIVEDKPEQLEDKDGVLVEVV